MKNSSYDIIVDYLAKKFKLDKNTLNLESTLMSNIGLDGDDVLDFLLKFFKEFEIDYEQTNYRDFIPMEGGFFSSTLISLFRRKIDKIDKNEIFVKDLVISLDKKKWHKDRHVKCHANNTKTNLFL